MDILLQIFHLGLQAAVAVLIVLVLRAIFLKIGVSKKYIYALWFVPFARLLFPWSFELSVKVPFRTVYTDTAKVVTKSVQVVQDVSQTIRNATVQSPVAAPKVEEVSTATTTQIPEMVTNTTGGMQFEMWHGILLVYVAVMVVFIAYGWITYLNMKKQMAVSIRLRDNIYLSDGARTPFVLGFIKPRIYLPSDITDVEMKFVIPHEQMHIRRKDQWVKMIAYLLTACYWWNPFVWVAYAYLAKDMEFACDEMVIKAFSDGERTAYASTLLELTAKDRHLLYVPLAFGEGNTKGRITSIMKYKKPVLFVSILACMLIVCLGVVIFINGNGNHNDATTEADGQNLAESSASDADVSDEVKAGVYRIDGADGSVDAVIIRLWYDGTFTLSYGTQSPAITGNYQVIPKGDTPSQNINELVLMPIDGSVGELHFEMVQRDQIAYLAEASAAIPAEFSEKSNSLADGTLFSFNLEAFKAEEELWLAKYDEIERLQYEQEQQEFIAMQAQVDRRVRETELQKMKQDGKNGQIEVDINLPRLSQVAETMTDGLSLDYVDEKLIVFHGSPGLYIYDRKQEMFIEQMDLKSIGCHFTQGDEYCEVTVAADGSKVYLHPMSWKSYYIYDVKGKKLYHCLYEKGVSEWGVRLETNIYDTPVFDQTVAQSSQCAVFDSGDKVEYGYLMSGSGLWDDIRYVQGDTIIEFSASMMTVEVERYSWEPLDVDEDTFTYEAEEVESLEY